MANVAKYDREAVIHKAMELFWEKGFHGTSTRDLQQAVDMRPGSIYSAFGSKEGLFSEALNCYSEQTRSILMQYCEEQGSPITALETFMTNVIIDRRDSNPSELCMLVKTLSELGDEQPELIQQTRELMKRTERCFAELIEQARQQGEIPADTDSVILAKHLQVQMIGLRAYMKASGKAGDIRDLIASVFNGMKQH